MIKRQKLLVMTGGGTAGHCLPNLALAEELLKNNVKIHYIGGDGIEKQLVSQHKKIVYHQIKVEKLRRSMSFVNIAKNMMMPIKVFAGYLQAKQLLKELKPNVVFSKGGFVSVPVCFAARKLKIPIICHESDLSLGLASKLVYKKCECMFCSFEKTAMQSKKLIHSGSIIRQSILNVAKKSNKKQNEKTNLLVIGGSLGAAVLNGVVVDAADELCKYFNITLITGNGKKTTKTLPKNFVQIEYSTNIETLIDWADVVVSRAGSGTIFELAICNKKMLLVPLSKKRGSRGDQIQNAKEFEKLSLATVILEENLNKTVLLDKLLLLKYVQPKSKETKIGNEIILKKLYEFLNV